MQKDPNPINDKESLELMKEKFSNRLQDILYKRLTVDNIENFADEALDNIIDLTSDIYEYYKNSGVLEIHEELELRDQEDDAYNQLGLPKISEILSRIEEKKNEIDKIKDRIRKEYTDIVITPPQENEGGIITGDGKSFEKKKLLPRLLTLMYILENDLEIESENIKITEGQVHDNMMRKTPYVRVEIPDLERLVYICDEEGNASYIFDTEKLREKRITPEELDIDDKGDKNSLIHHYPGVGVRIIQTKNWRERIRTSVESDIASEGEDRNPLGEVEELESDKTESEFKKREKKLDYDQWIIQLENIYKANNDNVTNFMYWYKNEAKNHKNWPTELSNALKKYKKSIGDIYIACGYVRKFEKKEYLIYDNWIKELIESYERDKHNINAIHSWYTQESKKRKDWYSTISQAATAYGKTLDQIFDKIKHTKKIEFAGEYIKYDEWINELKSIYDKNKNTINIDIHRWYAKEAKEHKDWYKTLYQALTSYNKDSDTVYRHIGYIKKIEFKDEYLSYNEWINELKSEYEKDKDTIHTLKKWYRNKSDQHSKWYSTLEAAIRAYKITYKQLYEMIEYTKKHSSQEVYLSYSDWIDELKSEYRKDRHGVVGIHRWYKNKSKNREGWYSSFQQVMRVFKKTMDQILFDLNN